MKHLFSYVLATLIWLSLLVLYLLPFSLIVVLGWLLGHLNLPKPFGLVIFSGFSISWLFCWGVYIYLKMQGLFTRTLEKFQDSPV